MSQSISVSELQSHLPGIGQLVDVRSASEFSAGHIPGAVNIPMDQIEARLADLLAPCGRELTVLEGGTSAWMQAGLPVVRNVKTRWSLERQVRLGAGLLVLAGVILGFTVSLNWIFLSAFVGLGLTFAGLTDICLMGEVLGKMPWNGRSHCKVDLPRMESGPTRT